MMKIKSGLLTSISILLSVGLSNGQTEKGTFLFGGQTNLSFLSVTTALKTKDWSGTYDKNKSFEFSPKSGYFFSKNLIGGIMIPFTIVRHFANDNNDYKSFSLQFIPLIQKYFGNKKIRPFIFAGGGPTLPDTYGGSFFVMVDELAKGR